MPTLGLHCSHEQFAPEALLDDLRAAERAGFAAAMCSDHYLPWTDAQGHSGHAWVWLGAALEASTLPLGAVTTPGYRHHPALLAQAVATLARMYPGRFWLAVGSGERLNEHVVGGAWPIKDERNARLRECVDVMRALWRGQTVNHAGRVTVEDARLYSLPPVQPALFGAALTEETAAWVAGWADGLITVSQDRQRLRKIVDAFRDAGGDGKPMHLQVKLSYAGTDEAARAAAHAQWKALAFDGDLLAELKLPEHFEHAAKHVRYEDVESHVHCSADLARHIGWLHDYAELGFGHLYLHNVNTAQRAFIDAFGADVVPAMSRA